MQEQRYLLIPIIKAATVGMSIKVIQYIMARIMVL